MVTGAELRARRQNAQIAGAIVCLKAGIARSRLSDIERDYVTATSAEIEKITAALNDLARAKEKIAATAAREGWPSSL